MRIVTIFFLVLLAGCGYHVPGNSDTWAGGEARVVYIDLFENQTSEPYVENYLTNALIAELSRSRVIVLTEDLTLADVRLAGEVKAFRSDVFAYGSTDRITNYRATMQVAVRLLHKGDSGVLWQKNLQRSEDYTATVSKNLQLEGQRMAAFRISQRLAEDIYASLLNSF